MPSVSNQPHPVLGMLHAGDRVMDPKHGLCTVVELMGPRVQVRVFSKHDQVQVVILRLLEALPDESARRAGAPRARPRQAAVCVLCMQAGSRPVWSWRRSQDP